MKLRAPSHLLNREREERVVIEGGRKGKEEGKLGRGLKVFCIFLVVKGGRSRVKSQWRLNYRWGGERKKSFFFSFTLVNSELELNLFFSNSWALPDHVSQITWLMGRAPEFEEIYYRFKANRSEICTFVFLDARYSPQRQGAGTCRYGSRRQK